MASSRLSSPNALTACSKYSSFVITRHFIRSQEPGARIGNGLSGSHSGSWLLAPGFFPLFVSQSFNGAKNRRTISGIQSEDQTCSDRSTKPDRHPERRDACRKKRHNGSDDEGDRASCHDSQDSAYSRQYHRLKHILLHYVSLGGSDRLADAYFPRALRYGYEHDVHHADTADDK